MADHMFLLNGSIEGRDWQFETEGGPYVTNGGQEWARVRVRAQPASENLPCGIIDVDYDSDGEPFATYARLVRVWNEEQDRREDRRYA
jgi:hypothetical protein